MATSVSGYYVAIWILQKKSLHYLLEIEVATYIPPHRLVIKILFHKKRSFRYDQFILNQKLLLFIRNLHLLLLHEKIKIGNVALFLSAIIDIDYTRNLLIGHRG